MRCKHILARLGAALSIVNIIKIAAVLCCAAALTSSFGLAAESSFPAQTALTTVFDYANFNSVEGLTVNGDADTAVNNVGIRYLRITSAERFTGSSSVWYSDQVNVAQGFVTHFKFRVRPLSSSWTTADGFAFVIQGSGPSALGDAGGWLGYTGIADSLAVEFDTFTNPWDPNNNHVAIQSCGTAVNTTDHSACNLGIQPDLPFVIADNQGHECTIAYVPGTGGKAGTLRVGIDKQPILTIKVNLQTLLDLPGNEAWVGFTGGTGSAWEIGAIVKWSYSTLAAAAK